MGETSNSGISLHHVFVGEYVGAADVEPTIHLGWQLRASHEVVQHVTNSNRLNARAHPTWGDHGRKSLSQVAQHFEGQRAASDDDPSTQRRRWNSTGKQDVAHIGPRPKMARHRAVSTESAEVDDATYSRRRRGASKCPGDRSLGIAEGFVHSDRVHEIVRNVNVGERGRDDVEVGRVSGHHLNLVVPRSVAQPLGVTGENANGKPGRQQFGNQSSADISRGSGDQCAHTFSVAPAGAARRSDGQALASLICSCEGITSPASSSAERADSRMARDAATS